MDREGSFQVGEWQIRPPLNEIQNGGEVRHLEPRVMSVLSYLARHPGEVLSKERLIQAVWSDRFVTDDVLKQAIFALRKVLGDQAREPHYIRTIARHGYQLLAKVDYPKESASPSGHYVLDRRLEDVGIGEAWLALDMSLGRRVVIKFLRTEEEADKTLRRRLRREALAAAALDHPYIRKVYDFGTLEGRSYVAMEFVEGETLRGRLERGPLPIAQAVQVAHEMAEALEIAHRHGIVHRAVEPSNVILTDQGHGKITDFGIAKRFRQDATAAWDWTISRLGEPNPVFSHYISPEQAHGEPVDQRTDIFLFGATFWEMVTGHHPFERSSEIETNLATLHDDPPPLTRYSPDIPEFLGQILRKMLAKKPVNRYQSIQEFLADLKIFENEQSQEAGTGKPRIPDRATYALVAVLSAMITILTLLYLTRLF